MVIGSYLTLSLLEALPERFEVSKTRLSEPAAYGATKVGLGLMPRLDSKLEIALILIHTEVLFI